MQREIIDSYAGYEIYLLSHLFLHADLLYFTIDFIQLIYRLNGN